MQIQLVNPSLTKLYRYVSYEETLSPEASALKEKLNLCETLRDSKVSWSTIKKTLSIGRSNYYRYKNLMRQIGIKGLAQSSKRPKKVRVSKISEGAIDLIKTIRKENPTYGKAKIAVILKRDYGEKLSDSSVGRVLKKLLESGKIQRSCSTIPRKRKRSFKKTCKMRWIYGKNKPEAPGEMMQLDHMSVSKNGVYLKEFHAWDPLSKYVYAQVFTSATSSTAKKFLEQMLENVPFKIKSIQVDGGSEFMADFEQACADLCIALYVLPPKKPNYNGGVERSNRILKEEFYCAKDLLADSLGEIRFYLKKAVQKYNEYRPHKSLDYLTPLQYIKNLSGLTA